MAAKKNKKEGDKKPNDQNNNDGGKKESGSITVVLKTDMHCDGCATKIKKCILGFKGVESLKGDDKDSSKLSVTGKVDPFELRDKLEQKTKKKVELVSPLPPKKADKDKDKDKNGGGGGGGGGEKKNEEKVAKKPDEKKSKELQSSTAVFKLNLHCEGCIQKIHKYISKTKGYEEMSLDRQKDLVTVKGTMDMKAMAETLKEKLKRPVEIVPPKKEGGGDKKEKGGGEVKAAANGDGNKPEQNKLEHVPYGYPSPYPYPYPHPAVVSDYAVHFPVHAPQFFSDENPNACSVM